MPEMPAYDEGDPQTTVAAQTWLADFMTWAMDTDRRLKAAKELSAP